MTPHLKSFRAFPSVRGLFNARRNRYLNARGKEVDPEMDRGKRGAKTVPFLRGEFFFSCRPPYCPINSLGRRLNATWRRTSLSYVYGGMRQLRPYIFFQRSNVWCRGEIGRAYGDRRWLRIATLARYPFSRTRTLRLSSHLFPTLFSGTTYLTRS